MAYMDVRAAGQPNGHTVVLLHGNNFAGFYFGGTIDALRKEGFRVIVPDQIGYGRSSKPIIPYNFHDMARNTRLLLQSLKHREGDGRRPLDGRHARRALRDAVSRRSPSGSCSTTRSASSIRASIGHGRAPTRATSGRSHRPTRPSARASCATSRTTRRRGRRSSRRYTRIRYAWTLSADWPRLAMVQTLISQVQYLDPVVDDWAHIKAPTLVFGGAEDMLPGSAAIFQERMKFIADDDSERQRAPAAASRPRPRAAHRGAGAHVSAARRVSEGRGRSIATKARRCSSHRRFAPSRRRDALTNCLASSGARSSYPRS